MILSQQTTLPLYKFKIHIQATSPIEFYNFPGIAFRGGFGHILKKSVCVFKNVNQVCKDCLLINNCVYVNVFENINYTEMPIMKKASHLPHPFVLTPIIQNRTINEGDEFYIHFTIIGKAISYLPYLIYSLIKLGEEGINKTRGTYSILKIINIFDNSEIYNNRVGFIENEVKPYNSLDVEKEIKCLNIKFLTPCKIVQNKREVYNLSYEFLLKNILRRIKVLSNLYGEMLISEDYEKLMLEAKEITLKEYNIKWEVNERYSKRQNNKMPLMGYTGYAKYEGKIRISYKYLKIAEILNIGKNTSFGYGALSIEIMD